MNNILKIFFYGRIPLNDVVCAFNMDIIFNKVLMIKIFQLALKLNILNILNVLNILKYQGFVGYAQEYKISL